jgi:hypothetical protein
VVVLQKTRTAPRAWARRVSELELACTCWECLRRNGITPHREAPARYRTDVTGRTFRCDKGNVA